MTDSGCSSSSRIPPTVSGSNKDITKLTKTHHVAHVSFTDLLLLFFANFHGVVLFLFGTNSIITGCYQKWMDFLGRGDLQHIFRAAIASDPELPTKIGWFVEHRAQSFLTACADPSAASITDKLLQFDHLHKCLEDRGVCGLCLCPVLHAKLPESSPPSTPPLHREPTYHLPNTTTRGSLLTTAINPAS